MATDVSLTRGDKADVIQFSGNISADDTVTLGDQTYTFKADPSSANEVDVGSDEDTSINNLVAAINLGSGSGSAYDGDTVRNAYFTATADTENDRIDLKARYPGDWVNGVHLAVSGANLSVEGSSTVFGDVSGTDGAGRLEEYISGLLELTQIPSPIYSDLARVTEEEQSNY